MGARDELEFVRSRYPGIAIGETMKPCSLKPNKFNSRRWCWSRFSYRLIKCRCLLCCMGYVDPWLKEKVARQGVRFPEWHEEYATFRRSAKVLTPQPPSTHFHPPAVEFLKSNRFRPSIAQCCRWRPYSTTRRLGPRERDVPADRYRRFSDAAVWRSPPDVTGFG